MHWAGNRSPERGTRRAREPESGEGEPSRWRPGSWEPAALGPGPRRQRSGPDRNRSTTGQSVDGTGIGLMTGIGRRAGTTRRTGLRKHGPCIRGTGSSRGQRNPGRTLARKRKACRQARRARSCRRRRRIVVPGVDGCCSWFGGGESACDGPEGPPAGSVSLVGAAGRRIAGAAGRGVPSRRRWTNRAHRPWSSSRSRHRRQIHRRCGWGRRRSPRSWSTYRRLSCPSNPSSHRGRTRTRSHPIRSNPTRLNRSCPRGTRPRASRWSRNPMTRTSHLLISRKASCHPRDPPCCRTRRSCSDPPSELPPISP